ncbi:hypothetical protein [Burkholderia gladioli]|uniref:hypothetical protein n=1 Tax=Burkholderia gladioli TaxID=28095 RepID=UPI0016415D6D|nr:hypothetical protein [Burkholderia gladioli]
MSLLPEHQKLKDLNGANQIVGDFIEWLSDNGCVIAQYEGNRLWPITKSRDALIAEHFGIDQKRLDAEKEQMLDEFRAAQTVSAG